MMLAKMVWKEGGGLWKSLQGMTTNLQAYRSSNNLRVRVNTNLHGDLGWSKTNNNFSDIPKALGRDHQEGTVGTGKMDGPPAYSAATTMESSSNVG